MSAVKGQSKVSQPALDESASASQSALDVNVSASQSDLMRFQRLTDAILQHGLADFSQTLSDAGLSALAGQVKGMRQHIMTVKSGWSKRQSAPAPVSAGQLSASDVQRIASAVSAMLVSAGQAPASQPALTIDQLAILSASVMPSQAPASQPASVLAHGTDANVVNVQPVKTGHGLWSTVKGQNVKVWSTSNKSGWLTEWPCCVEHSGMVTIQLWQTSDASMSAPVIITPALVKGQQSVNKVTESLDADGLYVYSFQLTPALGLVKGQARVNVKLTSKLV
jgi:hypothetical protein